MAFNGLAVLLLLPILAYLYGLGGPWLWRWQGPWFWIGNGLALLAAGGFLWTLRWYDGGEFLGLRQLVRHQHEVEDQERFHLSPLHRFVRHPWYFLGLMILWTRDMNGPLFLSAVLVSAYLYLGAWLEERKLCVYHGDLYRRYRARVPGLLPLPWRYLRADEIEAMSGRDPHGGQP